MSLKITRQESLELYKKLILARLSEEKIRQEYYKDEMKTPVHLGIGGEAIQVGVWHCVPKNSQAFGTYRNHTLYLMTTENDTDSFFAELYGRATGPCKGKAGSMHLMSPEKGLIATSAVVATTIPLAVGAAFTQSYNNTPQLIVCFFGDGAIEEGVFWESLNFATFHRLPILFVCEDNDLAIHTPSSQRRSFSIPNIVKTFDVAFAQGNGADVLEVISCTKETLQKMDGQRPGFLHLTYFRHLEHVGPQEDFEAGYRRRPLDAQLKEFDPILRFEKTILENKLCNSNELAEVRQEVGAQINSSIEMAQTAPFPSAHELHTDVFVENL